MTYYTPLPTYTGAQHAQPLSDEYIVNGSIDAPDMIACGSVKALATETITIGTAHTYRAGTF